MKNFALFVLLINCLFLYGCNDKESSASNLISTSDSFSSLEFKYYEYKDVDGIASVSCPSNMTAISGGCTCDITTTGEIFSLNIIGNSAICGCGVVYGDYDEEEIVLVSVICANILPKSKPSPETNKIFQIEERLQKIRQDLIDI